MANRYWVGGTATWDGTAGTKWALTSGGAGGQAVPTAADDVFFDGASGTVTCTVSGTRVAKSITCTGFTGTLTNGGVLQVSGNVTLVSGMTYSGGTLRLVATSTLISAGKTLSTLEVSGAGITATLGDALNTTVITLTQGTLDTSASNYSITAQYIVASGTNTRAFTLNGSTVTVTGTLGIDFSGSNLTLNAGTSSLVMSAGNPTFTASGFTFYNVSFTDTSNSSLTLSNQNTFNNLSISARTSLIKTVSIGADQTINGTLTCSGSSGIDRMFLSSSVVGTARTLTVASCSPTDCDFRDITIAGAASPISGTRLGNSGGNSGITFPGAKTVYWNPASAAAFNSASWATSSGGTTLSTDNFPLAQDTAVIDNNSRANVSSVGGATWQIGTVDMSNRTSAFTFTFGGTAGTGFQVYGNWTSGTGVTFSGTAQTITFASRTSQSITSNGRSFSGPIAIAALGGTVSLGDALSTSQGLTLTRGTFNAANYTVTCLTFSSSNSNTRTLTLGSGTWTITGFGTVWNLATTTGLTFNKDTANITLSDTTTNARTFAGGDLTYNKLTIGGATGVSTLTFTGSNTFSELASTKTVAHTITFTAGTTTTVAAWTITGTSGNVVTLGSSTTSPFTLTKTGGGTVVIGYMSISYSTATPSNTWYAGVTSTDGGNNSGWTFATATTGNFLALF